MIDTGASMHAGPAGPGRPLTRVTGECMEYDGQAPAPMTLENGDAVHPDFAAPSVMRFVLSLAKLVDRGIEVRRNGSAHGMGASLIQCTPTWQKASYDHP